MGGWDITTQAARPAGTADADHPSYAKVERRRQSDLEFLAWVKVASQDELEKALPTAGNLGATASRREGHPSFEIPVKGWRLVAIQRRLKIGS